MEAEKAVRKVVITGGPCCGKTTTIQALQARGFAAVPEASRMLIEQEQARGGDLVPWKRLADFEVHVTRLQLQLEAQAREGVHFIDRGVIDNLAYCEWGGIGVPPELQQAIPQVSYDKVFLLLPLPLFENDPVRKESLEEAVRLTSLIKKAYQQQGYEVVEVPPVSVDERVAFILSRL